MTSSYVSPSPSSLILPEAEVRVSPQDAASKRYDPSAPGGDNGNFDVSWDRRPVVVAVDVSPDLLDPSLGLCVEVGRVKKVSARFGVSRTGSTDIVWPSQTIAGVYTSGHDRRDGGHFDTSGAAITLDRQTLFPVTTRNQVIPLESITAFMQLRNVRYWDATNPNNLADAQVLVPSGGKVGMRSPGNRKGYAQAYYPARFAFRYSIINPADPLGGRIAGPRSSIITVGPKYHPFLVDEAVTLANSPRTHVQIDPRYVALNVTVWLGPDRLTEQ